MPHQYIRDAIRSGALPQGYELRESDIGRGLSLGEGFGIVRKADVGKRCYHRSWGFCMENDRQRDERKTREQPNKGDTP